MKLFEVDYLVQINYNSGIKERFWCEEFKVEGTRIKWKASNFKSNDALTIGVNSVESTWQKGIRYKILGITIFRRTRK